MIKIGITGTREGMNELQFQKLIEYLETDELLEIHHGDCVGVDAEVAVYAKMLGHRIVCHPPSNEKLRAFTDYDECRPAYGYLQRDRNIVDSVDMLLVIPLTNVKKRGSGTWYTHDYAVQQNLPTEILYRGK